jgi:hypothetical protein
MGGNRSMNTAQIVETKSSYLMLCGTSEDFWPGGDLELESELISTTHHPVLLPFDFRFGLLLWLRFWLSVPSRFGFEFGVCCWLPVGFGHRVGFPLVLGPLLKRLNPVLIAFSFGLWFTGRTLFSALCLS